MSQAKGTLSEATELLMRWGESDECPSFWGPGPSVQLDYRLLEKLLGISVGNGDTPRSGLLAKCLDLWTSWEFLQAGFEPENLWPRLEDPRVVDPGALRAAELLSKREEALAEAIVKDAGRADVSVMGSAYEKQVDVGMASWPSGPELLVSTKTMSGSFGKNLANRFEEAYGDAKNLRERHPLAAHGFLYLVRSTVAAEGGAYRRIIHMLKSLAREGDIYDAVGLIVVEWGEEGPAPVTVSDSEQAGVPPELSAEHFFERLIDIVLARASLVRHAKVREIRGAYLPYE